ncbi:uncharacterized protein LOC135372267 [Ornithodoros turicata]|uniref:uncharacterized protein LOC135372267 n=1 Tax=Ornithodoros turicata TaxID=34597 RepID=UPI00313A1915
MDVWMQQRKQKILSQEICAEHDVRREGCGCGMFVLHGFPADKQLQHQWVVSINRKDFSPSSSSARVCSDHFVDGKRTPLNPVPMVKMGYPRKFLLGPDVRFFSAFSLSRPRSEFVAPHLREYASSMRRLRESYPGERISTWTVSRLYKSLLELLPMPPPAVGLGVPRQVAWRLVTAGWFDARRASLQWRLAHGVLPLRDRLARCWWDAAVYLGWTPSHQGSNTVGNTKQKKDEDVSQAAADASLSTESELEAGEPAESGNVEPQPYGAVQRQAEEPLPRLPAEELQEVPTTAEVPPQASLFLESQCQVGANVTLSASGQGTEVPPQVSLFLESQCQVGANVTLSASGEGTEVPPQVSLFLESQCQVGANVTLSASGEGTEFHFRYLHKYHYSWNHNAKWEQMLLLAHLVKALRWVQFSVISSHLHGICTN